MPTIERLFGFIDDPTGGGKDWDTIKNTSPTIPNATTFFPVTGGTFDGGIERLDRNSEVRGKRGNSPPAGFRAAPMMTIPVAAYRTVVEKVLYKALGTGGTPTGGVSPLPYVYSFRPLGYGAVTLPAMHAQMVRDDLNMKMAGATVNRVTLDFPLDAEGTVEFELWGKYFSEYTSPSGVTPTYSTPPDVFMLRDARAYLDGTTPVNEVTTVSITGAPTGGTFSIIVRSPMTGIDETASGIPSTATAAQVKTALDGLPSVDPSDTVVTGGPLPTTPVVITWQGEYGNQDITVSGAQALTGGTSPAVVVTPTTPGVGPGTAIPDLQGFSLTFNNNLLRKWYAGRNVAQRTLGTPAQLKKLWFPTENKVQAAPDTTFSIAFGNVVTAQEIANWYSQVQKIVFEVVGGPLGSTYSTFSELMRITLYTAEFSGGGAEALSSREDITSSFEGGVYLDASGNDLLIEMVSDTATIS